MKTLCLFICCLWVSSLFIEAEEEGGVYVQKSVYPKEIEMFKLSLSKKRIKELEDKIGYYDDISKKAFDFIEKKGFSYFLPRFSVDTFTDYELILKDTDGETKRLTSLFLTDEPYYLIYNKIDPNEKKYTPLTFGSYSIEEFFTPEEKAKMIELIPEWSPENIKKRAEERKKEEENRAKKESDCSSCEKKQEEQTKKEEKKNESP